MKLVATVKDSDYAYIDTFITFFDHLVTVINRLFNNAIEALGNLMNITKGAADETTTAA